MSVLLWHQRPWDKHPSGSAKSCSYFMLMESSSSEHRHLRFHKVSFPFPCHCFCLSSPVLPFSPKWYILTLILVTHLVAFWARLPAQSQLALGWCWCSQTTTWFLFMCKQRNASSCDNFFSLAILDLNCVSFLLKLNWHMQHLIMSQQNTCILLIGFIPRWVMQKHSSVPSLGWAWSWDRHLPKACSTLLLSSLLHSPWVQAVSRGQWHERLLGEQELCPSETGKELIWGFHSYCCSCWRFSRARWYLGWWDVQIHRFIPNHWHWLPAATLHPVMSIGAQPVKGHTNPTEALHMCFFIYLLITHNWWTSEDQPEGAWSCPEHPYHKACRQVVGRDSLLSKGEGRHPEELLIEFSGLPTNPDSPTGKVLSCRKWDLCTDTTGPVATRKPGRVDAEHPVGEGDVSLQYLRQRGLTAAPSMAMTAALIWQQLYPVDIPTG